MITITGASGKTGSKTAEALLKKGESVRVVGRTLDHLLFLRDKGAIALVGDQTDADFLTRAFSGADAAYVLIPPKMDANDIRAYYNAMGNTVVDAVKKSGLKKMVFLSSLGAEQEAGTGPVLGLHDVEKALDSLKDVDIVFLRPGYFYENTLSTLELIKSKHINAGSADHDAKVLMVASGDIGRKAAEILAKRKFKGHTVAELFGDRISFREVTTMIGKKLDLPDLSYVQVRDEEAVLNMTAMGMSKNMAESFVDLSHGISQGRVTTTKLNPMKPNAPTRYHTFVDEVLYPAYQKAA